MSRFKKITTVLGASFILLFSSFSQADSSCPRPLEEENSRCSQKTDNLEIIQCLNDYAKELLKRESRMECLFQEEVGVFLSSQGISQDEQELLKPSYLSLEESFQVYMPDYPSDTGYCIDFESFHKKDERTISTTENWFSPSRETMISSVRKQIESMVLFLKWYHVRSLGQKPSKIFPINRVVICDFNYKKPYEFELKTMYLDLVPDRETSYQKSTAYTFENLKNMWNKGVHYDKNFTLKEKEKTFNFTFISLNPFKSFTEKLEKMDKIKNLSVSDARDLLFHKFWGALNPAGRFRTHFRVENLKKGLKTRSQLEEIQDLDPRKLTQKLKEFFSGFDDKKIFELISNLTEQERSHLIENMKRESVSLGNYDKYFQCSAMNSFENKQENITIKRTIKSNVTVVNAHFIDVKSELGSLFQRDDCVDTSSVLKTPPQSQGMITRTIEDNIEGNVVVDTFDQVNVQAKFSSLGKTPFIVNLFMEALEKETSQKIKNIPLK